MDRESRFVPIEIESRDGEEGMTLVSHAPPWESLSQNLGGFQEQFVRGAFTNLDEDIVATYNHNPSAILGRTVAGTLAVAEDDDGLRYEVSLPDTTVGRDLSESIRRGDVRGSSFEFVVEPGGEEWSKDEDGTDLRTVTSARLFQVGPVTNPAYSDTSVALRSLEDHRKAEQDIIDEAEKAKAETQAEAIEQAKRRLRLAEAE